jgi:two-component system response regulator AtoC
MRNGAGKRAPVLVIEADPSTQRHLSSLLADRGYEPVLAGSVAESRDHLDHHRFLFTLLDPAGQADVAASIQSFKAAGADSGPLIVVQDKRVAEDVVSLGADVVVETPLTPASLERAIEDAVFRFDQSRPESADDYSQPRLQRELALWRSRRMLQVREVIGQAARVDVTVLIRGETGTGKDLAARAIHDLGVRQGRAFVKVNCAAVPRELLESELFGHERGAFTGAHELKIGKFESANRGSIFLDEIGDLHPDLQGKLLHVLQDGQFSRVGGRSTVKVDVRVLAATNQDLEQAVVTGRFRQDLYYRLNVIQIEIPPLRERPEEILPLAEYFVRRYAELFERKGFTLPVETVQRLTRYRYPGNVRELENVIKRIIVLDDPLLTKSLFPRGTANESTPTNAANGEPSDSRPARTTDVLSLKHIGRKAAQAAERSAMLQVLEQTRWNRVRAAKLLSISYRGLLYKMKEVGLDRDAGGSPAT